MRRKVRCETCLSCAGYHVRDSFQHWLINHRAAASGFTDRGYRGMDAGIKGVEGVPARLILTPGKRPAAAVSKPRIEVP